MTRFLLTLSDDAALSAEGYDEVFLWSQSPRSTFIGELDPYLRKLGAVNPLNVDLVRIAVGVLAADRSALRQARGANWNARELNLTVEVSSPVAWQAIGGQLAQVIGFLSGDRWTFRFQAAQEDDVASLPVDDAEYYRTVLLSGGADSAVGALISAQQVAGYGNQALVSHFSSTTISPVQQQLVAAIRRLVPTAVQLHQQIRFSRGSRRLDGSAFKDESSTRSRSLLFLALGLAVAERAKVPLWIPENGFASLNPPIGPDRRGSLSTRTTHPKFLHDLRTVLRTVGAHAEIENPFQTMTKGEMFAQVAERIGAEAASDFLSATNSCAHTDARYSGAPAGSSCGVCFGCLVRRASFAAAGLKDKTRYLCDDDADRFESFVKQKSIVAPLQDFARRGILLRTVMAMPLPADYAAKDALDLCQRGIAELRSLLL